MIENLYALSRNFLRNYDRRYRRYLLAEKPFEHRFCLLLGQRGVGKTTVLIQYLNELYKDAAVTDRILYVPADHFLVGEASLYEIAEEFANYGGEILCIDEIHKYPKWSGELKSIYDSFPNLRVIASGSSALVIRRGSHDLSRRALVTEMRGMSMREYVELTLGVRLSAFPMSTIISDHARLADGIITEVEKKGKKILSLFNEYLQKGYYPFSVELENTDQYHLLVEQGMHAAIESDLLAVHSSLSGTSIKRIKKLLSILAMWVPFTPDLRRLKTALGIGDERTLKLYLGYLEDAGIISQVGKAGGKLRTLAKPEKIYLNNSNQMYAITGPGSAANTGTLRETFFLSMVARTHEISIPSHGDFLLDHSLTFEIGGKSKDFGQIGGMQNSFLAVDGIERGMGARIPLWLFGFLY